MNLIIVSKFFHLLLAMTVSCSICWEQPGTTLRPALCDGHSCAPSVYLQGELGQSPEVCAERAGAGKAGLAWNGAFAAALAVEASVVVLVYFKEKLNLRFGFVLCCFVCIVETSSCVCSCSVETYKLT